MKYQAATTILYLAASAVEARNPKKGLSFAAANACSALEPHTDSSWWYSWSTTTGFKGRFSFCDEASQSPTPTETARANGMEFVPMFWSSVTDPNTLSLEQIANLDAATHVMGYNEPERTDQANLTPHQAASMWGNLVTIAQTYELKIVGPCMTKDAFTWYDEWLGQCDALYPGVGCHHDAVCIHMYMQPHPCDTSKSWECFGDETGYHAKYHLDRWWNDYGNKPIWVTEYGCYPWVQGGCDASKHSAIMHQMTSLFESPEYANKVERYAWFSTYASGELEFGPGALNVPNWESAGEGVGCPGMEWVSNTKPTSSWGIDEIHECVPKARANALCAQPLRLSMDWDNCYCAVDDCATTQSTWGGMKTFREMTIIPEGSSALSASGAQYDNMFSGTTTTTTTTSTTPATTTSTTTTTTATTTTTTTTTTPSAGGTCTGSQTLCDVDGDCPLWCTKSPFSECSVDADCSGRGAKCKPQTCDNAGTTTTFATTTTTPVCPFCGDGTECCAEIGECSKGKKGTCILN